MFEFKFTLGDEDYVLFNQYHLLNSPLGKKSLMNCRLSFPAVALALILIFWIVGLDSSLILTEAIVMIISSILWVVFSKKILLKTMSRKIVKMKKGSRLPYSSEGTLTFDGESIHEVTLNTDNRTNYRLIEKIAVTEKAIYIYFSSVQAYILPLTAFSSDLEKQQFLEFITSKVNTLKDNQSH